MDGPCLCKASYYVTGPNSLPSPVTKMRGDSSPGWEEPDEDRSHGPVPVMSPGSGPAPQAHSSAAERAKGRKATATRKTSQDLYCV